jgi:TP901 family phage tail tape measure protein
VSVRINVVGTYDGRDLERAQRELDALKRQTETLSTRMSALGDGFQNAGRQMSAVGGRMTRSITAPLVGIGVAGVKLASDFETSFAQIEGLVGVSGAELDELRTAALNLGPAFGAGANEAAEAMFYITSAGLRGTDAIEVLEASLKGAAVGLGDASTIADLATSAMNAYGSDVLSAAGATDVLAAAVREGKLEPAELSGAMGSVLPIASAMGISFDEVGATFAAMSRTGTGASEAATQLRGIMTGLLSPSVAAEKALADMGLSSADLRQQIQDEGLLSVLETLTESFADNEVGAEAVFGNVRALSGVMDLMGSNVDGTREIFENMSDTTGTLDDAFSVTADTSAFQFSQAMAEMKSLLMEVGELIMPIVRDLVEGFRGVVETFRSLDDEQKEQLIKWAGLAALLGPVILIVGKLLMAFGAIIKAAVMIGKVIMFLASPFGLVVAAVLAVIAIGYLLWKHWDVIKEKAAALWEALKEVFARIGGWVSEKFDAAKEAVGKAVEWIGDKFKAVANFIIGYWNGVLGAVESVINAIGRAINAIPKFDVPEWVPIYGGRSFGLPTVPTISLPRIPMLAEGGIALRQTLAIIGEAGPEAVVPLDRLGGVGGGATYVINVSGAIDSEGTARTILRVLRDAERRTGERLSL